MAPYSLHRVLELFARVVGGAFIGLVEALVFRGSTPMRRTYESYVKAWREAGGAPVYNNSHLLRDQFKQHSAPGAYFDPDGAALTPWLDAWNAGLKPRDALRKARQAS